MGIRVPEDVAILGFNNDSLGEMLDITTISLPLEWIGKMAVDLFENPEEVKHVKLDYALIKGKPFSYQDVLYFSTSSLDSSLLPSFIN
ncbi:substrate-binding domain-containing protein [[Brevibacterium] frigoritolerans]|uniref:Substrate-binding domain-containing protein n=1 Tax=Peribacillus frigoritolerans TaxID=450367 RepID=A0A941FK91_9BACI|nr:substrate-binding domain-containing protein [Peribacillus frigoritolerans]